MEKSIYFRVISFFSHLPLLYLELYQCGIETPVHVASKFFTPQYHYIPCVIEEMVTQFISKENHCFKKTIQF